MTADDPESVPIDVFPHPVLRYTLTDGRRVVASTNESFEAAFGDGVTGTRVDCLLAELCAESVEELGAGRIVDGDGATVALDTRKARRRIGCEAAASRRAGSS